MVVASICLILVCQETNVTATPPAELIFMKLSRYYYFHLMWIIFYWDHDCTLSVCHRVVKWQLLMSKMIAPLSMKHWLFFLVFLNCSFPETGSKWRWKTSLYVISNDWCWGTYGWLLSNAVSPSTIIYQWQSWHYMG